MRCKFRELMKFSSPPPRMEVVLSAAVIISAAVLVSLTPPVRGLGGSAYTFAVVYGGAPTVCGIVAEQQFRRIQCWNNDRDIPDVEPSTISYDYIAGGREGFCAVTSGGLSLICWNSSFAPKRIYTSDSVMLEDLTYGDGQVCALTSGTRSVRCWRGDDGSGSLPDDSERFDSVSSGLGFSCGVLTDSGRVISWGSDSERANRIQSQFINISMSSIVVGRNQACGFNKSGYMICEGSLRNFHYPLDAPPFEFSGLALGENHGCAVRRSNRRVVCWGVGAAGVFSSNVTEGVSFESVVAGSNFTCGLVSGSLSIICWGPGWTGDSVVGVALPLPKILPGPCVESASCCECGVSTDSVNLCSGNGNICRACNPEPISLPPSSSPPANPKPSPSKALLVAVAIVGAVGTVSGTCTLVYCWWTGGGGRVRNPRRQSSRRRQRRVTSKHPDKAEELSFAHLAKATNNFSSENKIGGGSYGIVYKGKLRDGREVAIKRGKTTDLEMEKKKKKKLQEKEESDFDSELVYLSRLHHKHLVRLVGYCEEDETDERLLVYEYMKNGALYDHLHDDRNVERGSSLLNYWKMRVKVALDAARGLEYLHKYASPPIIHRDVKSSNILLDSDWTARISDFGLSLTAPADQDPPKAAGTFGYIDPGYLSLSVLTTKSDVYGFGVVLLELLTGKKAIFAVPGGGGSEMSLVDFAVPAIRAGDVATILDPRVRLPNLHHQWEEVELVAYTAMQCVSMEGKDRPTMSEVVANLERALVLCGDSHGSISSVETSR